MSAVWCSLAAVALTLGVLIGRRAEDGVELFVALLLVILAPVFLLLGMLG